MNFIKKMPLFFVFGLLLVVACTQDDDGPIDIYNSTDVFGGEGFFLSAELDSGSLIHLADDTLYIHLDSIWSFSNCALKSITIDTAWRDTALELEPIIQYQTKKEDCASPMFRPDTILKVLFDRNSLKGISQIEIYNDVDSLLDTILVRHGSFSLDTFKVYIDSLFDSIKTLPLRTKGSPSFLKVLDSLTPRVYYWRPMKSVCKFTMDKCDKMVPDTLFPRSWSLTDTALVPLRQKCADSTLFYCKSAGWENDSNALGDVQERLDTLWHTHLYYVEKIPECGAVNVVPNRFSISAYGTKREMIAVRELYTPDAAESFCGPSTQKDMFWFDLNYNRMVPDTISMDSLRKVWEKATVATSVNPNKRK
ncbi:MAG: hypothetical protein II819_05125 [Fibrobacter sp.]|nr:hypothetical protein [Fibrobacter sp.]